MRPTTTISDSTLAAIIAADPFHRGLETHGDDLSGLLTAPADDGDDPWSDDDAPTVVVTADERGFWGRR